MGGVGKCGAYINGLFIVTSVTSDINVNVGSFAVTAVTTVECGNCDPLVERRIFPMPPLLRSS